MRIAAEVFNGIAKTVERFLDERAPVFFVKPVTKSFPLVRVGQFSAGGRNGKRTALIQAVQFGEEFTLELIPEYIDRNEKAAARLPDLLILCETAARDDTVHVDMIVQLLIPGMQHLYDAGDGAKIFRIFGKLKQCLCAATVKQAI